MPGLPLIQPSSRYRLYFDETGNGDLQAHRKDPNQRYLSLTGIVIRQDIHDAVITEYLTALKTDIFGPQNANIVLHRRDMLNAHKEFSALKDNETRARFDAKFRQLLKDLQRPAFTVSIDKEAHLEKYKVWQFSPYHYALTCLLERFVLWLFYSGKVGDVMGEARGPKHDAQLRRSFRRFYDNGTKVRKDVIQNCLTSRELRLELKQANITGLQIADLLAHPAHRDFKFEKLRIEPPNDYGTSLAAYLKKRLYHRSKLGKTEGYGRKWLP
jgi:hypothetical protein